ncbi:transposase [Paraburkholderia sp. UCT31]|uniref:transposase n=1 Tax=Paraburkholderia sp. UCT31 TaxID=2615209 RepID=UPI0016564132|nr:transposase [Paraburkholderia sp. UCT31]
MRKAYPSDVTDEQWARVAPAFQRQRGRPRCISARELLNAILYVMRTGCGWRALPHDFPKWQTVFAQRRRWTRSGVLAAAHARLLPAGHEPTVGIIDSTFIESAFGGGECAPSGYKRATVTVFMCLSASTARCSLPRCCRPTCPTQKAPVSSSRPRSAASPP